MQKFVLVHNKAIHLDSIDYVEYLDSGRSVIVMRGLHQEKQNIAVDAPETQKLRTFLEPFTYRLDAGRPATNRS